MRFWGSWSWLYFAGVILIVVSLIIYKVLELLSSSAINNNKFKLVNFCLDFSDYLIYFIATGIVYSIFLFLVLVVNLSRYDEQKKLYYSGYEVIVDFNNKYEKIMKTNAPDVLEEALRINNKYFEFVDGEMVPDEFYFEYITDDSWKKLKPINTNELQKMLENEKNV